ncbi:hypothetical protein BpHYR1_040420, partial [Brachionus plicatilis]
FTLSFNLNFKIFAGDTTLSYSKKILKLLFYSAHTQSNILKRFFYFSSQMRYSNSETRENSELIPNKLVEKEELIILEENYNLENFFKIDQLRLHLFLFKGQKCFLMKPCGKKNLFYSIYLVDSIFVFKLLKKDFFNFFFNSDQPINMILGLKNGIFKKCKISNLNN